MIMLKPSSFQLLLCEILRIDNGLACRFFKSDSSHEEQRILQPKKTSDDISVFFTKIEPNEVIFLSLWI